MSNNTSKTKPHLIQSKDLLEGAVTLVAALAWNEAAKKTIEHLFPVAEDDDRGRAVATFVYAMFVTILILCLVEAYNITVIHNCRRRERIKRESEINTANEAYRTWK